MKKINVLISCVGPQDQPGYADLLERRREINVMAESGELFGSSVWVALGRCDVLLIDEAVIDQYGFRSLRSVIASYPWLKVMLILDNESQYKTLTAITQGVRGVMTRSSCSAMLHKAVNTLFSGEAWVSRGLLLPIRNQLRSGNQTTTWNQGSKANDGWEKMN